MPGEKTLLERKFPVELISSSRTKERKPQQNAGARETITIPDDDADHEANADEDTQKQRDSDDLQETDEQQLFPKIENTLC